MPRTLFGGKPTLPNFYAPRLDGPMGYRIRIAALERGIPLLTMGPWPSTAERRALLRGARAGAGSLSGSPDGKPIHGPRMSDRRPFQIAPVAQALLGQPSTATRREWRYGARGSLSIRLDRATWYCHETGEGGGVLDLIQREHGCDKAAAARWYRTHIERDSAPPPAPRQPPPAPAPDPDDLARRMARARRLWARAQPAAGTVVERYLTARGLPLPPDAPISVVPRVWHRETGQHFDAMVLPLVDVHAMDDAEPVGAHVTFLHGPRKAAVTPAKKVLGRKRGAVAKITPDSCVIHAVGIAEGHETALALIAAGLPCWCAVDAGGVSAFPLLNGVQTLHIGVDHDAAGQRAASQLQKRWMQAGREVFTHTPDRPGMDWADLAQTNGDTT